MGKTKERAMAASAIPPTYDTLNRIFLHIRKGFLAEPELEEAAEEAPSLANSLTVKIDWDKDIRVMFLTLSGWVLRDSHEHDKQTHWEAFEVPATWWDMLKLRHFPKWWLRRWPARMAVQSRKFEYEQQIRLCPHATFEWPDEHHADFMAFRTEAKPHPEGNPKPYQPMQCPTCGIGIDDDGDGNCGFCGPRNLRVTKRIFEEFRKAAMQRLGDEWHFEVKTFE